MLAHDWIILLHRKLLSCGARILLRDIVKPGIRRADEFNLQCRGLCHIIGSCAVPLSFVDKL